MESVVFWPEKGLFTEDQHLIDHHNTFIDAQKNPEKYQVTDEMKLSCGRKEDPNFFKFLPTMVGQLNATTTTKRFSGQCFQDSEVSIVFVNNNTVEVHHKLGKRHGLCGEAFLYSTIKNFHVEVFYLGGHHKVRFTHLSADEMQLIKEGGIFIFRFCDKVINILPDFFKTLWLFVGGLGLDPKIPFFGSDPTEFQIKENIRFIKEATGYEWKKRPKDVVVDIDTSLIKSGDFLAITRFDGLDQIIEWGAGSHAGHSTMAIWIEGELWVVESQAAWYWPRKGIQKNPFHQWIKWARNADFMVTWLPLTEEMRAKFDEKRAIEWFNNIEGTPYGYHNFLFGWIDTPDKSYPPLLDPNFIGPMFSLIEKISPFAAKEVFALALNKRLGTQDLDVTQLAEVIYARGLDFPTVFAMPEVDGWLYPDGESYVCSSFVIAMWKAAGLFDGYEVSGTEFTPRDIYQMTYINSSYVVPPNCKAVDPQNPYCQIMGAYRMEFPGISTVGPYSHMNDHCPSEAPDYFRPTGC